MDSKWRPDTEAERELAAALEAGDGKKYAELLMTVPLYLPTLPDGSVADWPAGLPEASEDQVLVFTSPVTLFHVLAGHARGYEELTFDQLRERWPNPESQLIVDAGAPTGVFLTMGQVVSLAEGTESLVPIDDVQDAVVDGMMTELRRRCLDELGGDEAAAASALVEVAPNELERRLERAVEQADFDDFLLALLGAEVVVPTTSAVPDPRRIQERGFPWRIVGGEESPMIPVFSSAGVLDHIVPGSPHRVQVPFLDVVAAWPSQEHVLCFNPGTTTEFTLPAGGVPELAAAIAEADADEPL